MNATAAGMPVAGTSPRSVLVTVLSASCLFLVYLQQKLFGFFIMSRWGDEKTTKFVRLYRYHECLWDMNHVNYKSKDARDKAYLDMVEQMNDSELTVFDIKNKIKSLRSTYHQELNKIRSSQQPGAKVKDVYKPSLMWFEEMNFLYKNFVESRRSTSNEVQKRVLAAMADSNKPPSTQENQAAPENLQSYQPPSAESIQTGLLTEIIPPTPVSNKRPQTASGRNHPYRRPVPNEAMLTSNALQRLENIAATLDTRAEDEFYFFGQSVAAQLRVLPLNNAMDMQIRIQMLLSEERSRLYLHQSPSHREFFTTYGQDSINHEDSPEAEPFNTSVDIKIEESELT